MRCFDVFLAGDWSAASKPAPKKLVENAIWVGERVVAGDHTLAFPPESFFRTRHDCLSHLRERLREHKAAGRRVFPGFNFAFGYPAGFARALGQKGFGLAWRLVWDDLMSLIVHHPTERTTALKSPRRSIPGAGSGATTVRAGSS